LKPSKWQWLSISCMTAKMPKNGQTERLKMDSD
jgi:hypothetical protein